ncbi:hypothetical protein ACJMK2_034153 [Sinanodonta woodiana]|uniref:CD109 antigen n=1 Tax=Sinanodonta woodiana TaxID=1069815 RepID=A0ABD3WSU3_SINWO
MDANSGCSGQKCSVMLNKNSRKNKLAKPNQQQNQQMTNYKSTCCSIPEHVHHLNRYSLLVHGLSGLYFVEHAALRFDDGIRPDKFELFAQTDKALYKPGQTVHFRAFGMFSNMIVYTGKLNISIYDPKNNKIKQWLNVSEPEFGVVENFMLVDSEPMLGDWRIELEVKELGKTYSKSFTIGKYVLPKFDVTVELPPFILTSDKDVTGTVKAKYTYGKPVVGTVKLRADMDYYYAPWKYHGDEVMLETTFDINGEAQFTVPLERVQNEVDPNSFVPLVKQLAGYHVSIVATVTESLNNLSRNGTASVQFYSEPYSMSFSSGSLRNFKPGLPYEAYLILHQADGRPVISSDKSVEVITYVKFYDESVHKYRAHTIAHEYYAPPPTGVLTLHANPPVDSQSLHFEVHFKGFQASIDVEKPSFTIGNGALQISMNSTVAAVGHNVTFEVLSTDHIGELFYLVVANNLVVQSGKGNGLGHRSTNIIFKITEKMQPYAQLIVYYFKNSTEWNADSTYFDVNDGSAIFKNKVSLAFDKTTAEPGDGINLQITTDPKSLINLLAVDQSVLLMKTGNDISQTDVISSLKSATKPTESYYDWHNRQRVLQASGIQVLTDMPEFYWLQPFTKRQIDCNSLSGAGGAFFPTAMPGMVPGFAPTPGGTSQLQQVTHTRTFFPETWLWTNTTSNAQGHASIAATVPDTITSWVASAFSINKITGLGVTSAPATFRTFRPFFVSLNLPYSVVRGEELVLQANVFNYMTQDMDVVVTLEKSNNFMVILPLDASGNMQYVSQTITKNVKVAAGKAESVFIPIVPAAIGKIDLSVKAQSVLAADGVRRQLLVEPEGIHREYNYPFIIAAGSYVKVPIILPQNVVADSLKVRVTAMGDVMGPTLQNLDNLLQLPTGCGEQTMTSFAPDVFVTNYLNTTGQLTEDIREKALMYMQRGYQRELTFQHSDGSFSIWGENDGVGSMWLTAFVVKSFHQAKKHIYVSENVLIRAINWMLNYQSSDGSFPAIGSVHSSMLKGGSSIGYSLTGFCLIALLENDDIQDENMNHQIQRAAARARVYLESHVYNINNVYDLAITSYALARSGSSMGGVLFTRLDNMAIIKDGQKFWSSRPSPNIVRDPLTMPWFDYYMQSPPLDIEIAAYALLHYIETRNFASGLPVLKWLTTQRNANGGFQSTQDTVLALQAMSEYGSLFSGDLNLHLDVATYNYTHSLTVQKIDALVLKTTEVPVSFSQGNVPEVNITATGKGAALTQVHVSFYVEKEESNNAYNVSVKLIKETLRSIIVETCVRWALTGSSGMTVVEMGVPTGFMAELDSSNTKIPNLKKQESKDRQTVLYFDQFDGHNSCLYMEMVRVELVAKSQPASIRVYDYYEPDNRAIKFYQSDLLKDASFCDICADCGCTTVSKSSLHKETRKLVLFCLLTYLCCFYCLYND